MFVLERERVTVSSGQRQGGNRMELHLGRRMLKVNGWMNTCMNLPPWTKTLGKDKEKTRLNFTIGRTEPSFRSFDIKALSYWKERWTDEIIIWNINRKWWGKTDQVSSRREKEQQCDTYGLGHEESLWLEGWISNGCHLF